MKDGQFTRTDTFDFYYGSVIIKTETDSIKRGDNIEYGQKRYYVNGKEVRYCSWQMEGDGTFKIDIITDNINRIERSTV